jgi:hypothetical protein
LGEKKIPKNQSNFNWWNSSTIVNSFLTNWNQKKEEICKNCKSNMEDPLQRYFSRAFCVLGLELPVIR